MEHADAATMSDRAQLAWFDVAAGAAGDMLAGALHDAGVPLEVFQASIDAVVPGRVRWTAREVDRNGLRAARLVPELLPGDQPHRSWRTIRSMVRAADLAPAVVAGADLTFQRLADAEARVHGTTADEVEFHEVGGLDAIADIVGVCAALHHLAVDRVVAGPLALGSGRVTAAHGELPVPVPAVVELCRGWRVLAGGAGELTTPTGAALITGLAEACAELPAMTISSVGVGAGSRDPRGRANVARVLVGVGDASAPGDGVTSEVVLETNVDDLDPRVWPTVLEALLAAGASDAWLVPIVMKKGRPAHTLTVLAPASLADSLRRVVFATTSAIGLRETPVRKHALDRSIVEVGLPGGTIRVKVAVARGRVVRATPEFDDVVALAARLGRPVRDVLDEASAAVVAAGLVSGAPQG